MKKSIQNFIKKYITVYGFTIFVGIVASLCLIYFGEQFFQQGKELFEKYNFKFYLILVLCVVWLFVYAVYIHRRLMIFVKFVLNDNMITKKDIQIINKHVKKLEIQVTKEDEVTK